MHDGVRDHGGAWGTCHLSEDDPVTYSVCQVLCSQALCLASDNNNKSPWQIQTALHVNCTV